MSEHEAETTSDAAEVVVVGMDGSEPGQRALEWAQDYARLRGSTLRIVTAWQHVGTYGQPVVLPEDNTKQLAQDTLDKARASLTLPADRVQTSLVHGLPAHVLMSESEDASILVVGSRGRNALASALLGSVSTHAVRHAKPPVVVVR